MSQMKEQDKTPEEQLSEMEIDNLPEKEFRIMIVKMIQDLRKRIGGRDRLGVWDWHVHTAIFKVDNQQGPTV